MKKLKKIDENRTEIVEERSKTFLRPNFLLTRTVNNIVNQVKVPKMTPKKRKLDDTSYTDFDNDIETKALKALSKDSFTIAIPLYTFVDSPVQNKKDVTIKILNVDPLILDSIETANNLKELYASKETNPKITYGCKYCDKCNFRTEHNLLIHVKFSHLCKFCLKCFKKENLLQSHIKKLHSISYCTICNVGLNKHLLKNHLKKIHDLELPSNVNLINCNAREVLIDDIV